MWSSIDTESESQRTPSSGTATTGLVLITLGSSQHHAKTGNSDNSVTTCCLNFLSFGSESQNHGQQHRLPILEGVIKYKIMKLLQIRFVTMKNGVM